jgi:GNAT superfamily N-acetyltransferase
MVFKLVTASEMPELRTLSSGVAEAAWPEFMLHDPVAEEFWHYLYEEWPEYQYGVLYADRVVAVGNSVPLNWDRDLESLPDEGWDWILPKAVDDHRAGRKPNLHCAIQVMVLPDYQRKGLSRQAVEYMKRIGMQLGYAHLIVPARPSLKWQYPHIPIEEYVAWKGDDGLPFDPWLRVHLRIGAHVIKVCHRSMEIRGTVEQWTKWTGQSFPESGVYVVPGALSPVSINIETGLGVYIEPNVWLSHTLGSA